MKRSDLATRTRSMSGLGGVTLVMGALLGLYALVNAWGTYTSGVLVLALSSSDYSQPHPGSWPVAPGAELTWPFKVMVGDATVPAAARWLVQSGQALTPLLGAAALAALGWLLVRVGTATSVFDRQVRSSLSLLTGILGALAIVPTGLVLFGSNLALGSLGWAASTSTDPASMWMPLFASYLCLAFSTVLRHGAALAAELDDVI